MAADILERLYELTGRVDQRSGMQTAGLREALLLFAEQIRKPRDQVAVEVDPLGGEGLPNREECLPALLAAHSAT